MTIYVVERMWDYTCHLGYSTSREAAERAKEEYNKFGFDCWVTEYRLDENGWCEFDCD